MAVRLHPHARARLEERGGTEQEVRLTWASDGTVYGIELLNANDQLAEDEGNLIVELEGKRREIALRG